LFVMNPIAQDVANLKAYEELQSVVCSGASIALIGAGSSARVGYPAWSRLLQGLAERARDRDPSLDETLRSVATLGDSQFEAEEYRRLLGPDEYVSFMRAAFREKAPAFDAFHTSLVRLPFRHIVTTNYDPVLGHAHVAAFHKPAHVIDWSSQNEISEFLQNAHSPTFERRYLHLHGQVSHPNGIILTQRDYDHHYRERSEVGPLLFTLLATSKLVSIGFSLSDFDLMSIFRDVKVKMGPGAPAHMAILPTDANRDPAATRRMLESKFGIRPIFYPATPDHAALPVLIDMLLGANASPSTPRASAVVTPSVAMTAALATGRNTRPAVSAGEYIRLQRQARAAVERLSKLGQQLGWESIATRGRELMEAVQADPYRVAVAGRSRAGKSTLMNALVGRKICPAQRVKTTAVPIIIGPGERESASVFYEKNDALRLDGPITVDVLTPYADQRHNPNNQKRVTHISVSLPHQVLDLGIMYVDIPGFDDPTDRIWSATEGVIQRAHALVLVVDISMAADGGITLDKSTIEFLKRARKEQRPVFIVCNKADKLSTRDQETAQQIIQDELEEFGLWTMLPRQPFLLSAEEAISAQERGVAPPARYEDFSEALWESLWRTESIGLRRLYRVFGQLQTASEEVSALISSRQAQGADRELLQIALARCQQDMAAIIAGGADAINSARLDTQALIAQAKADIRGDIESMVQQLPNGQPLPRVSRLVDALNKKESRRFHGIMNKVEAPLGVRLAKVEHSIVQSLAALRAQTGLPARVKQMNDALQSLPGWQQAVTLPVTDNADRVFGLASAGGGTFAVITGVLALLGASLLLAGLVAAGTSAIVTSIVDLTDKADASTDLAEKAARHFDGKLSELEKSIDNALWNSGQQLKERIQGRMQPFMRDMRHRLDDIREPTEDELRLFAEMNAAVGNALESLVSVFRPAQN
jgi:GTP-binding protein EngB required for normal cell division